MTAPAPCIHCPWLLANQGKRHPDGWYTKKNLRRLWIGLRHGESMSCHPTDPSNPVSEAAQAAGYRPAPEGSQVKECVGGLVLQQREVMIFQQVGAVAAAYRRLRPGGMTAAGLTRIVGRFLFGGRAAIFEPAMPLPDLNAAVGRPDAEWPVDAEHLRDQAAS